MLFANISITLLILISLCRHTHTNTNTNTKKQKHKHTHKHTHTQTHIHVLTHFPRLILEATGCTKLRSLHGITEGVHPQRNDMGHFCTWLETTSIKPTTSIKQPAALFYE